MLRNVFDALYAAVEILIAKDFQFCSRTVIYSGYIPLLHKAATGLYV
jgi:hypothetical protein